jgi:hypothetical protein
VFPTPEAALLEPVHYCGIPFTHGAPVTCSFGAAPASRRKQIALIGDSHGSAMGPAVNYVAQKEGWLGVSMIHNGCGFSDALLSNRSPDVAHACYQWAQSVVAYLRAHRGVRSVFITGNDLWTYARSPQAGFKEIWRELPSSVRSIYVIRDVAHGLLSESDCVSSAIPKHLKAIGERCSVPRSSVLFPDAEADAAAHSGSSRVHLINLWPFFCGARCFPVIGGVLVLSDLEHITQEFSASLGPYILRAVARDRRQRH